MQEVDHVVAALGLQPGERVLDVGCGPGRHAHELARRGIAVHGIDISATFVELARQRRPGRGDVRAARRPGAAVRRRVRRRDLPVPGRVRADDRRRRGRHRRRRHRPGAAARRPPRAERVQRLLRRALPRRRHVRRRHRRLPRAHRGPRPGRAGRSRSTSGPGATRRASCACCSPPTASTSSGSAASSPAPTATTRRPPSRPSSSWSLAAIGEPRRRKSARSAHRSATARHGWTWRSSRFRW